MIPIMLGNGKIYQLKVVYSAYLRICVLILAQVLIISYLSEWLCAAKSSA